MKRIAHIQEGHIVNVSLGADDAELLADQMLESDALMQGLTWEPRTPDEIAAATRKAWPTVADFWAEFTSAEQLAIMDSAAPSLRLLLEALRMWRGEVWSDDARVTSGLDALTTAQVITDNRRKEIIAKTS
jgi:hypothetical protein